MKRIAALALLLSPLAVVAQEAPRAKYMLYCGGCHGLDGEGEWELNRIAPLYPNVGAFLRDPDGRKYLVNVGGVSGAGMTDADTAIVLNYVLQTFGKDSLPSGAAPFTREEIAALRANERVGDPLALRRQIVGRLRKQGVAVPRYVWD